MSEPAAGRPVNLPSLTALRWPMALLVFGLHVRNFGYFTGTSQDTVSWAFGAGGTGVSFFFVLSGFVLTWSTPYGDQARAFWRRRFARIYPLYLLTALVAIAMGLTITPWLHSTRSGTVANLLLVGSWRFEWWQTLDPVSWSLACEAFFYLLLPALLILARRMSSSGLCLSAASMLVLSVAIPWTNAHEGWGVHLYSWPPARLPEFVLGVAVARLVQLDRWRGPGVDIALAITLIGYFYSSRVPTDYGFAASTLLGIGVLIPALAVADLRREPSPWRRPQLVKLGEISYAFYLIHVLVLHAAARVVGFAPSLDLPSSLVATGSVFGVSLLLAWAAHEAVENPARRLLTAHRAAGARRNAGRPRLARSGSQQ